MTPLLFLEAPASRLRAAFDRTRASERGALVGCLPADEQSMEGLRALGGHVDVLFGQMTTTPIYVSGGISSPAQAEAIAPAVDGVVVRSAFVRSLRYARTFEEGLQEPGERAAGYGTAVRQGGRATHGPVCADGRCGSASAA